MTEYSADDARRLADEFKREGYFDQLKRDVLTQKHENDELPLEQSIRNNVADVVRKMVAEDENLIFKNRGSTSALIEAQLFKQGYKRLGEGENGIQLEEYLHKVLDDSELTQDIKNKLNGLGPTDGGDESTQNDGST
ncbi:hypothetical protein ZYGR_0AG03780 [Zygosaccharomyces rouxii]|uniref:BOD1/SHG1 domain-containing protein n=1 Tax=Zygosaccharomyces rouxii TaxID=4956 RepID=A0A1Q3A9K9_ZYGRO|nr:hypothetical protein ZYGR_0AG03780 [Zygosaccharomyces rouxii]